jgi:hypothetical protein
MKESIINFGKYNNLLGIITEPSIRKSNSQIILLLNAGLVYRIGTNRINVKIARELAKSGYISFRFDFPGIGDRSKITVNNESCKSSYCNSCVEAMDFIEKTYGENKFIVIGLCNGANIGFETAIFDSRITGIFSINGLIKTVNFEKHMAKAYFTITMRLYLKNIFIPQKWLHLFRGENSILSGLRAKIMSLFSGKSVKTEVQESDYSELNEINDYDVINKYESMINRGVNIFFLFSSGSNIYEVYKSTIGRKLKKYCKQGKIILETTRDVDHTYTPVWSQNLILDRVNNWLMSTFECKSETQSNDPRYQITNYK